MWVIYVIAAAFFVACIAAGYFGVSQREDEQASGSLGERTAPDDGRGRSLTADEVVLRLEHRIDAEIRDISYDLQAPERYRQMYGK